MALALAVGSLGFSLVHFPGLPDSQAACQVGGSTIIERLRPPGQCSSSFASVATKLLLFQLIAACTIGGWSAVITLLIVEVHMLVRTVCGRKVCHWPPDGSMCTLATLTQPLSCFCPTAG